MKIDKLNHIGFSFRERLLWVTTFLALLFVFSVSIYFSQVTYNSMVERGETFVAERAKSMKQKMMATIDAKFAILDYIASVPEIYSMDDDKISSYLKSRTKNLGFEYFFVVDSNYDSNFFDKSEEKKHHNIELFKKAMLNDRYISDPYTEIDSEKPITTLCTSIYDENGNKVGSLCAALSLADLYDEIRTMFKNGIVAAITQNGDYVLYDDILSVVKRENALQHYSDSEEAVDFITRGIHSEKTLSGTVDYHDTTYFVAMSDMDYSHWKLIYILDDDTIMLGIWNMLTLQLISIVMIVIAFILIFTHQYIAKKTKALAYTDKLTGLGNHQRCHEMLNYFNDLESSIMLICFDLNKFKEINDTLGHQTGDQALIAFSECLKDSFGTKGFVGRIGGDEFIALLSGAVQEKYDNCIEALNKEINVHNSAKDVLFKLSFSHGCSIRNPKSEGTDNLNINAMYYEADSNMYKTKKAYHDSLNKS